MVLISLFGITIGFWDCYHMLGSVIINVKRLKFPKLYLITFASISVKFKINALKIKFVVFCCASTTDWWRWNPPSISTPDLDGRKSIVEAGLAIGRHIGCGRWLKRQIGIILRTNCSRMLLQSLIKIPLIGGRGCQRCIWGIQLCGNIWNWKMMWSVVKQGYIPSVGIIITCVPSL